MKKILVTGGAGFIGSHFIRRLLRESGQLELIVVDKLTYAGSLNRLKGIRPDKRVHFVKGDICDKALIDSVISEGIDSVINFAAETHVDRSILEPGQFCKTNINGTSVLLEAARRFGVKKFVQISTDEVYGALGKTGRFSETAPLNPKNPYSASKAAADFLVMAYNHTYGLPALIIRPSNTFGPFQYPEKFVPVVITRAIDNQKIPLYADGENIREWIFVEDCIEGIFMAAEEGLNGEIYNIGSGVEKKNIAVASKILSFLGKPLSLLTYVQDRPGHDLRYRLNSKKISCRLGFKPRVAFEDALKKTIEWYMGNKWWWRKMLKSSRANINRRKK